MKCPRCGHLSEADSSFCSKCGSSLLTPKESPTQNLLNNDEYTLTFAPGDSFGQRYHILEELGKGGMGRVYKAEDKDLGIEVALKMIHPEFLANVRMISRFKKEILLAREITHENVVRIYDFGEINGVKFITMQYIEGKNLKELIREAGQVSVQETMRIFQHICTGLISAHKKEIVHRDLKPQNVMIDSNGKVFLTDFGLAKSIEGEELSASGTVIGTPEYISPEQACGEKADKRSDIYTLGIILFEMLTGQRPYQAKTALAYIQKHLHENPPPPSKYNPAIPRFLERIILKCMAKDMNKRFQSVEELKAEMHEKQNLKKPLISGYKMGRITRALYIILSFVIVVGGLFLLTRGKRFKIERVGGNQPRSMTILDFNNHTGKEELNYWRKAIPVLLTHDLYQSKYLRVIAERNVDQVIKELNLPQDELHSLEVLQKMADRLRINYILRGSFTGSGDLYRVIVNIWNVKTREEMSPVSADGRGLDSLNSIIDRLTKKIKFRLNINQFEISQDIDYEVGQISTNSPKALEYYVQGKQFFNDGKYQDAIDSFGKAIEQDSEFAMAYRITAWSYALLDDPVKRKEYFKKTLELKDHLNPREQYLVEGDVYGEELRTHSRSIKAYKELLKIYPEDYAGNRQLGTSYIFLEQWDLGIKYLEKCRQNMDPSLLTYQFLSYAYMGKGMYEKARKILDEYRHAFSDHDSLHLYACRSYFYEGKYELALRQLENLKNSQTADTKILKGTVFFLMGRYKEAEEIFNSLYINGNDSVAKVEGLWMLKDIYAEKGQMNKTAKILHSIIQQIEGMEKSTESTSYYLVYLHDFKMRNKKCDDVLNTIPDYIQQADTHKRIFYQIIFRYQAAIANICKNKIIAASAIAGEMKDLIEANKLSKYKRFYLHVMGLAASARGQYQKAVKLISQSISLLPSQIGSGIDAMTQALFIDSLGAVYMKMEKVDQAIAEFAKIPRLTTGRLLYGDIYARSFYKLGKLYQKKKYPGKAIENYRRFLTLWQEADQGLVELADAREQLQLLQTGN